MATAKFPITINFRGRLTSNQKDAFKVASEKWTRVLAGPLPAVKVNGVVTKGCIIYAQGDDIDGGGGILGMAGPTRLRPDLPVMGKARFLPCEGMMAFDVADLDAMERGGTLIDVITHEMGHVLGIGTVWRRKGVLTGAGTTNPLFNGQKCRVAFHGIGGQGNDVPVENEGGAGTRESHWRERFFRNELMTGYVSPSGMKNPLSMLTLGSLEDIGYDVDYAAADPYSISPTVLTTDEILVPRQHLQSTVPISF